MKIVLHACVFAFALAGVSLAQTNTPDLTPGTNAPASLKPAPKKTKTQQTAAQLQTALDQLTQSNRDLLDLLKKQQVVLEDIQFDRRLQSRQIQSLEERLTDTLYQNTQLQKQIAALEATAAVPREVAPAPAPIATVTPVTHAPGTNTTPQPAVATAENPPPAPDTFLPAPDTEGAPGTKSWHRLFTLKGSDTKQTDLFHIEGRTWRVIWHNQDPPKLANTSALFINAFPRDDTIPQKACAKLGTGGDKTELDGPGYYYLKIEASGGSWELAVEDFR